jgi:hypothetical protein
MPASGNRSVFFSVALHPVDDFLRNVWRLQAAFDSLGTNGFGEGGEAGYAFAYELWIAFEIQPDRGVSH